MSRWRDFWISVVIVAVVVAASMLIGCAGSIDLRDQIAEGRWCAPANPGNPCCPTEPEAKP